MASTPRPPLTDLQSIKISQPAQRALAAAGIKTLAQLAKRTEADLLALHGVGPKAITILKPILKTKGLTFKADKRAAQPASLAKAQPAPVKKAVRPAAASVGSSAAGQQIDAHIAALGDWRGKIVAQFRQVVLSAVPGVAEDWKWGTPVWALKGNVVAAGTFKDHVKLNFFKGAALSDPKGLFNAGLEAKGSRGIDLHEGDKLDVAGLKDLIRAAAALNGGQS